MSILLNYTQKYWGRLILGLNIRTGMLSKYDSILKLQRLICVLYPMDVRNVVTTIEREATLLVRDRITKTIHMGNRYEIREIVLTSNKKLYY